MERYTGKRKTVVSFIISLFLVLYTSMFTGNAFAEKGIKEENTGMVEGITVTDGYFINDFEPDVFYYDVYMASFAYNLSVSLNLTNPRFEYTISGNDTITADSNSENVVTISVYDPLGEYESVEYYLNIYVGLDSIEDIPWTGLSYLDVENGIFSPQFSRYRITYYAILENNVDSFEAAGVNYRTLNLDAAIEVNCRDELNEDGTIPEGKRVEYAIKVTESSGKSKTYYLNLYRKAQITSSISDTAVLSNIRINGGAVEVTGFAGHKSYYDVTVPKTVTNLDIQAYPVDRSDLVQVIGPVSMNEAEPIFVNILVTSPSEETYSIYTLRLSYDSFIYTEKYSAFQLLVYLLLTGVGLFVIGFFTALYISRKKKPNIEKSSDLPDVEREVTSIENVPMA